MGKYFGRDGVRGVGNKELRWEVGFKLGGYGGYVLGDNEGEKDGKVVVGRDRGVCGEMLECGLIGGLICYWMYRDWYCII